MIRRTWLLGAVCLMTVVMTGSPAFAQGADPTIPTIEWGAAECFLIQEAIEDKPLGTFEIRRQGTGYRIGDAFARPVATETYIFAAWLNPPFFDREEMQGMRANVFCHSYSEGGSRTAGTDWAGLRTTWFFVPRDQLPRL